MPEPRTVWTVGHSTRDADAFVALLDAHGIALVLDVRRYAGSRRFPHFNSERLAATLAAAGIAYRHDDALGGRREARADSVNDAWRNAQFRGYADHMAAAEFRAALAALESDAARRRVVLMCAEAVPWRCHRQLIADALVARGWTVRHILATDRADVHELSAHARPGRDGVVRYPAGARGQASLFETEAADARRVDDAADERG
jgi:uncharacterized protein (DUF488 family)